jgi:L-lactate dehydrogenase complex protein LldG
MLDVFKAKAEAVSAEVVRVASAATAVDAVLGVLEREHVEDAPGARAVWCEGSILRGSLDRAALVRRVPGLSFDITKDRAADSRVGVSELDWALAATGTIAQDATDPRTRLASMLTETHVSPLARRSAPDAVPRLHHRTEPHGGHRARADDRGPRAEEARDRDGG